MSQVDNQKDNAEQPGSAITISESQLVAYCAARIVKRLQLKVVPVDSRFEFSISVWGSWAPGEHQLVTYHTKLPRQWKSLDRVMHHIRDEYHYKGRITLDYEELERWLNEKSCT